jgi:hypothetical protein
MLICRYKKKFHCLSKNDSFTFRQEKKYSVVRYFSPREAFGRPVSWRGFVQILSASEPENLRPEKLSTFLYPRHENTIDQKFFQYSGSQPNHFVGS